jgi:sugar-specific transcriptional regulator TrmB
MPPAIKNVFQKVGLGEKEVSVMLSLLSGGPMLASEVATAAKLNRTTTYGLLKDLSAQGLVTSITKKGKATRYQSIAPEMLPGFIERRQDELAAGKKELEEVIPQINLLRNKGRVLPKVQYFEGRRGVEQAYEDMIEHNKSKMIYALTGLEGALTGGLDQKFQDYFINKRMGRGIKADYIVPETEIGKKGTLDDAKKGRVAKFIPAKFDFRTEICVYDNRVSILSYSLEHPIALIIEDETIAHAIKQIFNYVWSVAK